MESENVFKRFPWGWLGAWTVLIQVSLWVAFLTGSRRITAHPNLFAVIVALGVITGVTALIAVSVISAPPGIVLLALVSTLSLLLNGFSFLYWSHGTAVNFGHPLSKLDAFYFTIGTLSTAGTGNVAATSEWARGVQSMQMTLDIMLIVFGVGLFVSRWRPNLGGRVRVESDAG